MDALKKILGVAKKAKKGRAESCIPASCTDCVFVYILSAGGVCTGPPPIGLLSIGSVTRLLVGTVTRLFVGLITEPFHARSPPSLNSLSFLAFMGGRSHKEVRTHSGMADEGRVGVGWKSRCALRTKC